MAKWMGFAVKWILAALLVGAVGVAGAVGFWERASLSRACESAQGPAFNLSAFGSGGVELKIAIYGSLDPKVTQTWAGARYPIKGSSFATLCDKAKGLCLPMGKGHVKLYRADGKGAQRVAFEFTNGDVNASGTVIVEAQTAAQVNKGCS